MVTSLLEHERVVTTNTKAHEVARHAEKMITRAKEDSVHNRRIVGVDIHSEKILAKLFTEIGPRMKDRNGGYTRIIKMGPRKNDGAEMVILELVDRKVDEAKVAAKEQRKAEKKAKQADQAADEGAAPADKAE
jgi:large subunit ribosomal protein L17